MKSVKPICTRKLPMEMKRYMCTYQERVFLNKFGDTFTERKLQQLNPGWQICKILAHHMEICYQQQYQDIMNKLKTRLESSIYRLPQLLIIFTTVKALVHVNSWVCNISVHNLYAVEAMVFIMLVQVHFNPFN